MAQAPALVVSQQIVSPHSLPPQVQAAMQVLRDLTEKTQPGYYGPDGSGESWKGELVDGQVLEPVEKRLQLQAAHLLIDWFSGERTLQEAQASGEAVRVIPCVRCPNCANLAGPREDCIFCRGKGWSLITPV